MKESCGKYVCCARGPIDLGKLHIVRSIKMTLRKSLCKRCYFVWNSGPKSSFSLLTLEKIFLSGKNKSFLLKTDWLTPLATLLWADSLSLLEILPFEWQGSQGKKFSQNVWNHLGVICLFLFANYVKSEAELGLSPTERIKTVPSPTQ